MSIAGFMPVAGKGCDATHRAKYIGTHPTDASMKADRHFPGGRCARSFGGALEIRAFAPFRERANGALQAVRP